MPVLKFTATLRALHEGGVEFILVDGLRHGPLDLLGTIGRDLGYQELLPHSIELGIGDGLRIRVLDLDTLIAVKEQLGGEKDRAVLPILGRTLEEKRKAR